MSRGCRWTGPAHAPAQLAGCMRRPRTAVDCHDGGEGSSARGGFQRRRGRRRLRPLRALLVCSQADEALAPQSLGRTLLLEKHSVHIVVLHASPGSQASTASPLGQSPVARVWQDERFSGACTTPARPAPRQVSRTQAHGRTPLSWVESGTDSARTDRRTGQMFDQNPPCTWGDDRCTRNSCESGLRNSWTRCPKRLRRTI